MEAVTFAREDYDLFEWQNGAMKTWSTALEILGRRLLTREPESSAFQVG